MHTWNEDTRPCHRLIIDRSGRRCLSVCIRTLSRTRSYSIFSRIPPLRTCLNIHTHTHTHTHTQHEPPKYRHGRNSSSSVVCHTTSLDPIPSLTSVTDSSAEPQPKPPNLKKPTPASATTASTSTTLLRKSVAPTSRRATTT
jgi:hypothetical protein